MDDKKTIKRLVIIILSIALFFLLARTVVPGWTPKIKGKNSISEFKKVEINGAKLQLMIRGADKSNPVLIFVHGGPCCSEIPYVRKYQKDWEKDFTIVHYDQRGSGKSYKFGEDYSQVTTATHVEDLIALTEYIKEYLETDKVILLGHSFGTYIGTQAAALRPDLYRAYVGIGQMSDTVSSELNTLDKCIVAAKERNELKAAEELEAMRGSISEGKQITPRDKVYEYGFGARLINDNRDYTLAFIFGPEYNLIDAVRYMTAVSKYQDGLVMEALEHPVTGIVDKIDIPVYFVMGRYDGMTSPETAEEYLLSISGDGEKKFILFNESAHYPQFEEKEAFGAWLTQIFQ
ncbi:MAG: alpha/beta hydrolase [Lachnospiraceae bacterium]|nr:alpha/beta hydrolase [Lachnospiraceae bacterium]